MSAEPICGADIVIKALVDQGVDVVFGYPGGAVLPIYDSLFKQNALRHILVRQEGGAVHAAEGYARSTGKVGVVLVTSGPGATNAVTGLTDALMDSVPVVCLTGQVPTHLIGNDAFQEADTTGITRPCTKHNYLVKNISELARMLHEAFYVAKSGRPGPVVVDLPKDILFAPGPYCAPEKVRHKSYRPQLRPDPARIADAIDPSSINKNVRVDLPIVGDVGEALSAMLAAPRTALRRGDGAERAEWWRRIEDWRARDCLRYDRSRRDLIKPQYAIERLYALTRDRDVYITTEVGQHQMWAAQFFKFDRPNHWMTSGGLGTMGYGLPAAMGVQIAHPDALVIDIAGEASVLMNIQEMSTIAQYRLPVKVFIVNNQYMGMVRQWQELLHGGRYSESYTAALPDFVKLADAFGAVGRRVEDPAELDDAIREMLDTDSAFILDVAVDPAENCFPMIPSGAAHNEMLLGPEDEAEKPVSEEGMVLV